MNIEIDPQSPTPIYEQIRSSISWTIRTGTLRPGTPLPSIRQLAIDLGIAKATVQKAYDELFREHLIEARRGQGTVVSNNVQKMQAVQRRHEIENAALQFVNTAMLLNTSLDEALELIQRIYERKVQSYHD